MPGLSPRSPLLLPWTTLRLAGRFALPLALWFTVGQVLRYGAMYGGYRLGAAKGIGAQVAPLVTVSLLVMITLGVTVAMVHCVREGLATVQAREAGGGLAAWAVGDDEPFLGALGRAVLPFVIFYLAWGMQGDDARAFAETAEVRGFAEGGLAGQARGLGMLVTLERHVPLAIGLTVGFFALKALAEWLLEERLPRAGALVVAFLEVDFALFAIFTVDHLRGEAGDWLADRRAWAWVSDAAGPVLDLWPAFRYAVLGGLVWLVIAGVILGLDAGDERLVLGDGRAARHLARAGGVGQAGTVREFLTRGFRELWLPAWYGLRLVRRSGPVPFGVFCLLLMGLDVLPAVAGREVFELVGPHPVEWWLPRQPLVAFGVDLVVQMLRACLLAAAFDLVMARVTAGNAAKAARPSALGIGAAGSPAPPRPPLHGAASPGR
ncbi:hypothetical protein [Actinomadura macrotermitis]|uniref:Uncharacterized protein n=1 Tax=Actinomadura macrotermitis TaxID=2585200 RepID=A0A7K0BTE3_9ACTN|nr:hypothetical protein [Actinomadura macrotermitis]MQY04463.1 hypothetical protein [Actinomadura macrotermitis]